MEETHKYLSEHGVKPSVQRIAIMDYLLTHKTHPTADEIFQDLREVMPTLSKTTVYNTVKLLADQQAILALNTGESNVRYDGDVSDHAHFLCSECGHLFDMKILSKPHLWSLKGHRIAMTQIYAYGVCEDCSNQKNS